MCRFEEVPRPGFTKATVSAWRVSLEERILGSSSIIVRMSAIRKLAAEAADNGLLAPELAAGISRVKSAKTQGIRTGNWLSQRQAQALLSAPDISTLRGLRDRAILAVLLGCGLRRSEVAALKFSHLQQRDGRWCIVDLIGKQEAVKRWPRHSPTFLKMMTISMRKSRKSSKKLSSMRRLPRCRCPNWMPKSAFLFRSKNRPKPLSLLDTTASGTRFAKILQNDPEMRDASGRQRKIIIFSKHVTL